MVKGSEKQITKEKKEDDSHEKEKEKNSRFLCDLIRDFVSFHLNPGLITS